MIVKSRISTTPAYQRFWIVLYRNTPSQFRHDFAGKNLLSLVSASEATRFPTATAACNEARCFELELEHLVFKRVSP